MTNPSTLASQLKNNTTACRVSFTWIRTRKTLDASQRAKAAEPFSADKNYISATQKLIDTRNPAYAKLTSIKNEIVAWWKANTLPYTEDGIRLLHKDKIQSLQSQMATYAETFKEAVANMDDNLSEIKAEAKARLGTLYNDANYPATVQHSFGFEWDFPSIDPPEYLAQLAPTVYAQEAAKIQAKMQEAVNLAEKAFLTEFQELIATLHERLAPTPDGTKKVFRDSTITNLSEFFTKFKQLNIGSNQELDKLVGEAADLVKGIDPTDLRSSDLLRQQITTGLADISTKLDPLVTNLPRRKIIKPLAAKEKTNAA